MAVLVLVLVLVAAVVTVVLIVVLTVVVAVAVAVAVKVAPGESREAIDPFDEVSLSMQVASEGTRAAFKDLEWMLSLPRVCRKARALPTALSAPL